MVSALPDSNEMYPVEPSVETHLEMLDTVIVSPCVKVVVVDGVVEPLWNHH